jgi:hypothetical protein
MVTGEAFVNCGFIHRTRLIDSLVHPSDFIKD